MAIQPIPQSPQRSAAKTTLLILLFVVLLLLLGVLLLTCRTQKEGAGRRPNVVTVQAVQLPALQAGETLIPHAGFDLVYNEPHEQASWVSTVLRGSAQQGPQFERTDQFMTDPLVSTGSATDADYAGSGYDRGHLAPAEDLAWSAESIKQSFYYSNVSPQVPAFNRGVWKRLEELVRFWATAYDSVYVVTGPVLSLGLPAIGRNAVSVPERFYKVVLQYNSNGVRGIGFVLRNEASAATLKGFGVSIDSVESLTGIDFFPALPDNVEETIESGLHLDDWLWSRKAKK